MSAVFCAGKEYRSATSIKNGINRGLTTIAVGDRRVKMTKNTIDRRSTTRTVGRSRNVQRSGYAETFEWTIPKVRWHTEGWPIYHLTGDWRCNARC